MTISAALASPDATLDEIWGIDDFTPGELHPVTRRRSLPVAAFVAMRPRQWLKNGLVFLAPIGAGIELHLHVIVEAMFCFVALSLIAGATYLVNDILDIESDRVHPKKSRRPIAAGELPVLTAWGLCAVAGLGSLAIGDVYGGWHLIVVLVSYCALSFAYSFGFKHIEILDIASVAMCFVIRVIAGATATHAVLPHGMILCTGFGALFMVVGKRYQEFHSLGDDRGHHRKVLVEYTVGYLRALFYASASITALGYCLWAFERGKNAMPFSVTCFQLSIVPAVMLILQYTLLVEKGGGGAPEDLVLGSRRLQIYGALVGILFIIGGLHSI
jgi:decaprenyl-phosphate phosphoribosyltransferase